MKTVQIYCKATKESVFAEQRDFEGVAMAWGWDYHWSKMIDGQRVFYHSFYWEEI